MSIAAQACEPPVRVRIHVRGQVQGVGFRPFVFNLARALGLVGWVRNEGTGVAIDVQGDPQRIAELLQRIEHTPPPLARVDSLDYDIARTALNTESFAIRASDPAGVHTVIPPDAALCRRCLEELFDTNDRRYRYPFINCTHCGPRFSIASALPYDRVNTSMARFTMCQECQREYDAPRDRRFHAQANACDRCGPRLTLLDGTGAEVRSVDTHAVDAIRETRELLEAGAIVAIKGIGGFHLACDARNTEAVKRLRARKARDAKPFALMIANTASVARWASCSEQDKHALESQPRPIVLLRKHAHADAVLPGVAPGLAWLGAMLPYTPVHYLIFHEAAGRPAAVQWLEEPQTLALVMTSANLSDEPLVVGNAEALERLAGIADGFLVHDRDIVARCDDSVVRCDRRAPVFIRRARGYTPEAIKLPRAGPPVLACGAAYKSTVCLTRGDEAFVSQHLGDLDNAAACRAWEATVQHLMDVLAIKPEIVAHDLHPELFSTRMALAFADASGAEAMGVQHHHAHIAAVTAERHLQRPVLGLALDGIGLGSDGTAWGGELLQDQHGAFVRLGHLLPLPLPGGDRAAREPWRMAASALHALGRADEIPARFSAPHAQRIGEVLARGTSCPLTSSAGRVFDAAAGLLGLCEIMDYEGQAAMLLESVAARNGPVAGDEAGYAIDGDGNLSFLPLLARLADVDDPGFGAALFHATLVKGLAVWTEQVASRTAIRDVVLAGGCFLNQILRQGLRPALTARGFEVHEARQLPPNDGGISLGQAWVASSRAAAQEI